MTEVRLRPAALALVASAALLPWHPAGAAEWTRVATGGGDQHFYDRTKLSISGDDVTYWRKVVFERPVRARAGTVKSALYRERVSCPDHTLRALAWQLFADEGALVESSTQPDAEAAPVVPETVGDRFLEVMCGLAEAKRRREADLARDEAQLAAKKRELESLRAEVDRLESLVSALRQEAAAARPAESPESPPR
jgi:hypothetical protein